MNILLTGGTGYIGSHTALIFIKAGHNVFLLDNLSNSNLTVVNRLEKITRQSVFFVKEDVRNTKSLSKILNDNKIEAVVHFAGLKSVTESLIKPIDYFDSNIGGVISLLQAMLENNLKNLVFSSSAAVYGEPQYLPLDENHPTSPINPYGRTKLYIENLLKDLTVSDKAWRIASLRYFNPVGSDQSGLIGESPKVAATNLMPLICNAVSNENIFLKIYGNDYATIDGTGVRDYIHVLDLADGHLAALRWLFDGNIGFSAFNLGSGRGFSVLELINSFESVNNCKIPYKFDSRRSGDTASCFASAEKAYKVLKWKASRDLKEMCKSAWAWHTFYLKNL